MAVQEVNNSPITREIFDEALRIGNHSVTQANKHMRISRVAVDAIHQALALIKSGRITEARDRLDRALLGITRLSAQNGGVTTKVEE
jgi:hypothetical protein